METTGNAQTRQSTDALGQEESATRRPSDDTTSPLQGVFTRQYSESQGGVATDLFCPSCGDTISGTYLPIFRCPHCEILIWRDDQGTVTHYEQRHTCPECCHAFNKMHLRQSLPTAWWQISWPIYSPVSFTSS